ncbi:MAG: hypothetical protein N3B21_03380 [Clostridia bacterium]|nr:hypothetical protein [Clostridia bacterium]
MFIKHITIQNVDTRNVKNLSFTCLHEMHINLSNSPDELWKKFFFYEWRREFIYKKKRIEIIQDELRLVLGKNDDIQQHIEVVKQLISRVNTRIAAYKKNLEIIQKELQDEREMRLSRRYRVLSSNAFVIRI